ncbi:MspA family porin [Corynebacterium uropygiale]|uniref:MspA family porin n=1 Tax=Corynebacterium uropygiale TaxID=1775911 RepID=A0A9X1TX38_9CORY|nr:MspA family porin [Corynebacterium uropygiale]MCF4005645.1 MspA family porin [Corynebacterium uropygiale]
MPVDFLPWPFPVSGVDRAMPDRVSDRVTSDGWVVHAGKFGERVFVNPPLDGSVTTGEAFGSVDFKGWIDGQGDPALSGAVFEAGYQVGCGVDISGGVDAEVASVVGSSPAVKAGVEGGPSVSVKLPNVQGATAGVDATGTVEGTVSGKAEVAPTVNAHLDPGGITNVVLVSMPMDPQYLRASGGFSGAQVKVEGCIGPVTVRSFATVSTTSPTSVDSVSVYGDPQRIR